jgi:hypothetical protein
MRFGIIGRVRQNESFNLTTEITEEYGVHRGLIMSYLNSLFSVHSSVHSVVKLDFDKAP